MAIANWHQTGGALCVIAAARRYVPKILTVAALGLAGALSVGTADAQNLLCPGVTVTGPGGVACGANTGLSTAQGINASTESALDNFRNKGTPTAPVVAKWTQNGIEQNLWGQFSYLNENQSGTLNGTDIGQRSNTYGGLFGYKAKFTLPADRVLTLGIFGGEDFTNMTLPLGDTLRSNTPMLGGYAEYDVGDSLWSEMYYTHSWFQNSGQNCATSGLVTECAQEAAIAADEIEGNVYYRFNPNAKNGAWWWEPTVGFIYDHISESQGIADQSITRLQGGANFGTSFNWGGATVFPTIGGLLFSDVAVNGGTAPGGPPVINDQGQLWGEGILRLKFVWSNNFSSTFQGDVYGTGGTEKMVAYEFLVRLKYRWGSSEPEGD